MHSRIIESKLPGFLAVTSEPQALQKLRVCDGRGGLQITDGTLASLLSLGPNWVRIGLSADWTAVCIGFAAEWASKYSGSIDESEFWSQTNGLSEPWAAVTWNSRSRIVRASRGPIGLQPLFCIRIDSGVAFATDPDALVPMMAQVSPNRVAIRNHLCRQVDADQPFIEGLNSLSGGRRYNWQGARSWTDLRWRPAINCGAPDVSSSSDELWAHIRNAVRLSCQNASGVAAELSGGLDSAGITWALDQSIGAEEITAPCKAVSARFPGMAFDERSRIDTIATALKSLQHYSWNAREFAPESSLMPCRAWPDKDFDGILGARQQQLIKTIGVDRILSGFGGDQIFDDRLLLQDCLAARSADPNHLRELGSMGWPRWRPVLRHILKQFGIAGLGAARRQGPSWLPKGREKSSTLQFDLADQRSAPTHIGVGLLASVTSARLRGLIDRHSVAWARRSVTWIPPLLSVGLISLLASLPPRAWGASRMWRTLWRQTLRGQGVPDSFALGVSKVDMSPVLLERASKMKCQLREVLLDRGLRLAAYVDRSRLSAELANFDTHPTVPSAYWLRAAYAIELWLRTLP